jgi:hypothetical protein
MIRRALEAASVEFIDENGGGATAKLGVGVLEAAWISLRKMPTVRACG